MKKLKTIEQFEKEQSLKKSQMESVLGGAGPYDLEEGLDAMTDDYSLGNVTGPYPLDGQCDCVDFRDGEIWGGTGTGPGVPCG